MGFTRTKRRYPLAMVLVLRLEKGHLQLWDLGVWSMPTYIRCMWRRPKMEIRTHLSFPSNHLLNLEILYIISFQKSQDPQTLGTCFAGTCRSFAISCPFAHPNALPRKLICRHHQSGLRNAPSDLPSGWYTKSIGPSTLSTCLHLSDLSPQKLNKT